MGTHLPVRQASRLICAISSVAALAACNTTAPMYSNSNNSVSLGSLAGSIGFSSCPSQPSQRFMPEAVNRLQFSRSDESQRFYLPAGAYVADWSTQDRSTYGSPYARACPAPAGCVNLIAHLGNDNYSQTLWNAHHRKSISAVVCNLNSEESQPGFSFVPPDSDYNYPYAQGGYSRPTRDFEFRGYRSPRYQYQ